MRGLSYCVMDQYNRLGAILFLLTCEVGMQTKSGLSKLGCSVLYSAGEL